MKLRRSILIDWENKFPGLDPPWTHWWISGDGSFLDTIAVLELGAAVNIVKNNWKKFDQIKVNPAKYEEDGSLTINEKRNVVIYSSTSHRDVEET